MYCRGDDVGVCEAIQPSEPTSLLILDIVGGDISSMVSVFCHRYAIAPFRWQALTHVDLVEEEETVIAQGKGIIKGEIVWILRWTSVIINDRHETSGMRG